MEKLQFISKTKEKISIFTTKLTDWLKQLLYKLFIGLLYLLRYGSLLFFCGFLIYFTKNHQDLISFFVNQKENKKETLLDFTLHWPGLLSSYTKDIPLIKGYTYSMKGSQVFIDTFHRVPTFLFQNRYYDAEGVLIADSFEGCKSKICNVTGNNNEFLLIYKLFSPLQEEFDLIFNGMRWDVVLYKPNNPNKKLIIKLPIEVDANTLLKVYYLQNNFKSIKDNVNIIDLRFGDKIYFIE